MASSHYDDGGDVKLCAKNRLAGGAGKRRGGLGLAGYSSAPLGSYAVTGWYEVVTSESDRGEKEQGGADWDNRGEAGHQSPGYKLVYH